MFEGRFTARRCSDCSIQYPPHMKVCQVCKGDTWGMAQTPPDDDWEEQVARLLDKVDFKAVYPHPEGAAAQRYRHADQMWFKHEDLIKSGYAYLEAGGIIFVNREFYELEGYSHQHESWWVTHILPEGAFEEATPEAITETE